MSKSFPLFHVLGVLVVGAWLTLMALLVHRTEFSGRGGEGVRDIEAGAFEASNKEWREIFLKDRKVGYAIGMLRPFKEGYFVQEELFLKLNLMGLGRNLYALTQAQVDERLLLRSFQFMMTSGAVRFRMAGRVDQDVLILSSGGRSERRIPLAQTPMLGMCTSYFFRSRQVKVGDVFQLPFFDPSTLLQKDLIIKVTARETLTLRRIPYDAFRLETEFWGKPMVFWIDENGETLKEEGFMGFTAVKSSAAVAPQEFEGGGDLYEMTAVVPDRPLKESTRLRYLKIRLEGLGPMEPLLNRGRQRLHEGVLEIEKEKIPAPSPYPLGAQEFPPEYKEFLEPEFNIESRDKEILSTVQGIAGEDRNPVSVARKLLKWVYRNVEKKPVLSIPSALEVLRTRAGDCNEHATLLTAFLRAAGIPSRISIGLVYTRDKFYYHAWTEAYLGQWISMDATLDQMPADASHIKLLEGNLDQQVQIAGGIGEIKVSILAYRHD